MSLGQKLLLTSVFLLVAFNIAVTIVRGSIFGGVYKQVNKNDRQVLDTSWAIFWYYIEFMMCAYQCFVALLETLIADTVG